MTTRIPVDRNRALRMAGALVGLSSLAVTLGGCMHTGDEVATTASIPEDYRLRHPIAVQEANQSVVIFVGHGRGGLTAEQRADVMGLAQTWRHEATGPITADVPVDTSNAAAAADAFREVQALLIAGGVPPRGINLHRYHPSDPRQMAAIRLNYPKISATAGPCCLWPEDVGDCGSLRPVAGGSRPLDPRQELYRQQVLVQSRLCLSARHGGDGRQSGRPGAAAA